MPRAWKLQQNPKPECPSTNTQFACDHAWVQERIEKVGRGPFRVRETRTRYMTMFRGHLRMVILGLMDTLDAMAGLAPDTLRYVCIKTKTATLYLLYDNTSDGFVLCPSLPPKNVKKAQQQWQCTASVDRTSIFSALQPDDIKEIKFGGAVVYSRSWWSNWFGPKDDEIMRAEVVCK